MLFAAVLLLAALPCQVVRLANLAGPFAGWVRTTVDGPLPVLAGVADGVQFVVGRQVGDAVHVVDLRVTLAAGEARQVNLAAGVANQWRLPALPANPIAHFGGIATIAGVPLAWVSLQADGAGYLAHQRARVGRMFCADLWTLYRPDEPGWAAAEVIVTCSNPGVPDLGATVPEAFVLQFGDALTWVPGRPLGAPLIAAGTMFGDGQARALPLTFVWPRHVRTTDWTSVGAAAGLGVRAVGLSQLLPDGNPLMPIGFSGRAWAAPLLGEAVRRLHTWETAIVGPLKNSSDPGRQEVQTYHPGGEAMVGDGVGAELVRYLSAMHAHASRPCNQLEADGSPFNPVLHPHCLFWDGRVHWHPNVSPDRLGKPRTITSEETNGFWGPDVQHNYVGDLAAAARLTGSPACQWLLDRQAMVYLMQSTVNPAWSTSAVEGARQWGCEANLVLDMAHDLEDRALAGQVVQRWTDRMLGLFVPQMAGRDLWKVWDNDARVNPTGQGVQWWQEAFAAGAIDRTAAMIGPEAARAPALRMAKRVLASAWSLDPNGQWRSQAQGPIDGTPNDGNPASHAFDDFGMPLSVWCVLRHEPLNQRARAIMAQLLTTQGEYARRWLPPTVLH